MYLQNTFYITDTHSKAIDLALPPPTLTDRHPPEPHKIVLSTAMAYSVFL
jgi:hypothetical protein